MSESVGRALVYIRRGGGPNMDMYMSVSMA